MPKIALLQNQGTMSYSSKTDIRPLLEKLGYSEINVSLYTSYNIKKLKYDLEARLIDAVIISSNSLNDNLIKQELSSISFQKSFQQFLATGNGCLILHQARLAKESLSNGVSNYEFLPTGLTKVKAKHRGNELVTQGEFMVDPFAKTHPIFLFPNQVNIDEVQQFCLQNKALYWHYLDEVDPLDWDVLLYDESGLHIERPLLISTKTASPYRIAITSLNLDWQKEENLLNNLLWYIVNGDSKTAILKDATCNDMAYDFLLAKLNAEKYNYHLYSIPQEIERFKEYLCKQSYQVVLMGPYSTVQNEVIQDLHTFIMQYADEGSVKYLRIEDSSGSINSCHFRKDIYFKNTL
jgi:hypothetical protein